jgi:carboxypeptidase Taq
MEKTKNILDLTYDQLMKIVDQLPIIQSTINILNWDMETKMPPKGITLRSKQLALLSGIEHKMTTNPKIGTLLDKIEADPNMSTFDAIRRRNVYLIRKKYDEQTKLPLSLVEETERQRAITIDIWKKAKASNNFSLFKSELEKLVELKKRAADLLMEVKGVNKPYDALIDLFEPGITSKTISNVFNNLKQRLIPLLHKCLNSSKQPDISILKCKIPISIQRRLSLQIAKFLGYDVTSEQAGGRIDETEHPFTTGYYDDVRITTHYYENHFTSALFSILHEAGHALYDQNLPSKWMYQPIGESCSLGFHESQSRLVENVIGRSLEFWTYFYPILRKLTHDNFAHVKLNDYVRALNMVTPSKIRVEADEITYCLHVIIRFEIEQDLIAGRIEVAELPKIWNKKYGEYLGVKIENDSEGVMQDTHWAAGIYGYFPTYALGNIYCGQILSVMEKELPLWRIQISEGNFQQIKQWLIKNVHQYGNLYDPQDLMKKITGESINIHPYINYLETKYAQLYAF